jgi:hypothetical protein
MQSNKINVDFWAKQASMPIFEFELGTSGYKKAHDLLAMRGHYVNWHFAKALTKKALETLKQTRDTLQDKHRITIE